jgi:hypothetical protein
MRTEWQFLTIGRLCVKYGQDSIRTFGAPYFRTIVTLTGDRNDGSMHRTGDGVPPPSFPLVTLLRAYWCGTVLTWQVAEPSSHSSIVGITQLWPPRATRISAASGPQDPAW